jgi:hypothetical protein
MPNIIGESFRDYVAQQVETRQFKLGQNSNENGAFTFLSGKTPFLKLTSGINVSEQKCTEIEIPESYAGNRLASNFILFGGTSFINDNGVAQQRLGVTSNYSDLFGNASYGMVSNADYGLVPMPGVESATVKSLNRGSLREAEIKLKCFNTLQFNIIETLFLRLKYSFLLEWGHTIYYNNDGTVNTTPISNSEYYLEGNHTQKEILAQIENSRKESSGNYDAFLGYVVNFTWNLNSDGSYDISIKARTPGDVIESMKINVLKHDPTEENDDADEDAPSIEKDKDKTTLNLIFNALREKATEDDSSIFGISLEEASFFSVDKIYSSFLKEKVPSLPELKGELKEKYLPWTNQSNSTANLDTSGFGNLSTENDLSANLDFLLGAIDTFTQSIGPTRELVRIEFGFDDDSTGEEQLYIKFGALCRIIEQYCLIYDTGNDNYPPIVSIDSDYRTNYCFTVPEQFSTDPRICMIPLPDNEQDSEDLNAEDSAWNRFWSWAGAIDDASENLETLNKVLSTEFRTRSNYVGRLMHIHINCNYVSDILGKNIDEDGNLSLYDFFTTLLQGVQRSLGSINKFEVIYDEDTNAIRFMDNTQIPGLFELIEEPLPEPTRLNVNTFRPSEGSFVRDVSIKTEISKDIANMMTVGAQSNGNVVGENATAFSHWNVGLTDRVTKEKQNTKDDAGSESTNDNPPDPAPKTPEEKFAEYRVKVLKYLLRVVKLKLDEDDIETYSTSFRPYLNYIVGSLSQPSVNPDTGQEEPAKITPIGFIPLSLDINMLGISGIKVYQKYTINEQLLPPNYKNKIEFLTKGVSHAINADGWFTTIDGQSVPKNNINEQKKSIAQKNSAKGSTASSGGGSSTRNNKTSNNTNPSPPPGATDTPNADRLRAVLKQVGFHEKGDELSNGGDITKETADYGIQLVRAVAAETSLTLIFTGGNDRYHQKITRYTSRHKLGRGLDFVISPRPKKIREVPKEEVKKYTRAQAQALYDPTAQARIKQIEDILKGFTAANSQIRYKNEYYNPTLAATGPHFHTSVGEGSEGSREQKNAIAEANAGQIQRRPLT